MSTEFKFFIPSKVSIGNINYGGHVGNDVFLSYFQETRIGYLNHLGFSELNIGESCGLILIKAEVNFKAELFHKDELKLFSKVSKIKNTSFVMDYLIEKIENEKKTIACTGQTVLAAFDYEQRQIRRVPDVFREKIAEIEYL